MYLFNRRYPSFCGPLPLMSIQLHSGEEVLAIDLRGNKDAVWLRASYAKNGRLAFSIRKGSNPARKDMIIGRISDGGEVSISRHEGVLVFKDDNSAMAGPMCLTPRERISRIILPEQIVFSWPGRIEINRKRVDDLVPKENGATLSFPELVNQV